MTPQVSHTKAERRLIDEKLADGEVFGGSVFTIVTYSTSRVDRYPRLAQRLTSASSTTVMAAWRRCVAARRLSPATASSDGLGYTSTRT